MSLLFLLLIPTVCADDNETIISEIDSDNLSGDFYFDINVENDTGDGSKDNPYKELKTDRINSNSVIHLKDGEYNLKGSVSSYNVTFIGESSQNTIISNAVFSSSSLVLKNINLKSSKITNSGKLTAQNVVFRDSYSTKGAVIASDTYNANINIINCTFENNHAQSGGAIYATKEGVMNIQDSTFINNYAQNFGGAIVAESGINLTIKKSKFINDYSVGDAAGAIYLRDIDKFIAQNLEFINCTATFGGAITSLRSNITLFNISAQNNKAKYNGGAFYSMYGYITLKNSVFKGNTAENGGAVFVDGAEIFNIYSNKFISNTAQDTAGGVYCLLSEIFYNSLFDKALNNSFSGNKAKNYKDAYKTDFINMTIGDSNYILMKSKNTLSSGTLPTSYDLRNLGQVTSVKNQGSGGNCWAFASLASLESCILKATGTSYDLSENNMKNIMSLYSDYGWSMDTNTGGYDDMGVGYLTGWFGPVKESDDAYYEKSTLSPLLNSLTHIQNVLFLTRTDYTDNDAIKRAIMDYGAVATCVYWSSSYIKDKKNYYYSGTASSNHAVTIIGWDDNYSRNNFNKVNSELPKGNGAWIVKNSWGTNSGDSGYFYVSYYDSKLATVNKTDVSYTFILNDTVRFDKNYQYDIPGRTDFFLNKTDTVWYKNKFTSTANEYLRAVSTHFQKETDWELSIYVNNVLKYTQNGKSPSSYSTINLNKLIPLKIGDVFEIEFKITVDGDAGVPISEAVSLNHEFYAPNISYVSYDGINWVDFYGLEWTYPNHSYLSQVACIKAFTTLNNRNTSTNIESLEQSIKADKLEFYLSDENKFSVKLLDKDRNPLVDKKVSFTLLDETYTTNTNREGVATIDLYLYLGKYDITVFSPAEGKYLSSTLKATLKVLSTIKLPSSDVYTYNSTYSASILDSDGKPLANKEMKISIDSHEYKVFTDSKGIISYDIFQDSGKYLVEVTNLLNDEVSSQEITVVNRINNNKDFTAYFGAGKSYKVKVLDDNGKPAQNVQVKFNINGKNYYRYTDSDGYALLKIGLKPNTYEVTATYKGFTVKNAVVVKPTIITKDTVAIKGKTIKFTAKLLSSKGKILKNKKVTFKFKGKTYKVKTNSKGKATLKITKKYKIGFYKIKTSYGDAKVTNRIIIK